MAHPRTEIERTEEGDRILHLQGSLDRDQAGSLWRDTKTEIEKSGAKSLVLDFREIRGIDSAGIALLRGLERLCSRRGLLFSIRNVPEAVDQFLSYTQEHASEHRNAGTPEPPGGVSRLGAWVLVKIHEGRALIRFVGDFAAAGLANLIHPRQMRIREVLYHTQVVGTDAMPLAAGLSFLMGIIMAFQAATTLQTFGAAIYVADIVTISTTREMGPLLTAVIIAGRSGAAFAAEIGTMKINEEIDALEVMGFDITRFLVLPRVFALMLAGPLLTLLADAAGIAGGASAAVVLLDLSAVNFFAEVNKILTPADIYTGLIKGFGFAALVGFIGCFRGLRASMAAESVGVQATSAVVSGILLIIVADAVFTAIFQIYGW